MKVLAMLIMSLFVLTTFHGTLAVVGEPLPGAAELHDREDPAHFGPIEQEKPTSGRNCEEGEKLCLEGNQDGQWLAGTQASSVLSDVCIFLANQMSREFYELLVAPVCEAKDPLEDLPDPPVPIPFVSTDVDHEHDLGFHGAGFSLQASFGFSGMGVNLTGETTVNATAELPEEELECDDCLPDLSVDPVRLASSIRYTTQTFSETDCNVEEGNTEPGTRDLIRFTTKIPNLGNASLSIGDPTDSPDLFEWGDCHEHWHFIDFVDHRLWNRTAYEEWRTLRDAQPERPAEEILDDNPHLQEGLVSGHKMGFCLIDIERAFFAHPQTPRHHTSCTDQGISAGWADVYASSLDGQFIDITDVEPGLYVLELEVNPGRTIEEGDYTNNDTSILVVVP